MFKANNTEGNGRQHRQTAPSRRNVLWLAGTYLGASLTGCVGSVPRRESTSEGVESGIDRVPETDIIATANVNELLTDQGIKKLVNTWLDLESNHTYYEGPSDFDEALGEIEDEIGLDPEKINEVTGLTDYDSSEVFDPQYAGGIISADWDTDDVVDAVDESISELDEDSYEEETVYKPESDMGAWVWVLPNNSYVIGTEEAVKDTIDVLYGDTDTLDEAVRDAFRSQRSGLVTIAGNGPTELISRQQTEQTSDSLDIEVFRDIVTISGVFYRNEENRGVAVTLEAEDKGRAEDIANAIDEAIEYTRDVLTESTGPVSESFYAELDEIEFKQNGAAIDISYKSTIDELETLITDVYEQETAVASLVPGFSKSQGTVLMPGGFP